MKRKISAKIAICYGRAMSKLFYKFPVSTDPFKFCEMQLLDNDDFSIMMEIWWSTRSENHQLVELFTELADLKPIENLECKGTLQIPKNPNYGGSSYNNPTIGPRLQIHLEVIISTEANVREMTDNGEDSDQDVEDFSDPDVDEVLDDIDDEGPKEVEDVHDPSFSNSNHGTILRNGSGGDMLNFNELFVGQQFENKADCVFAIKQYSMKLLIDYNVFKSTPTLYVGECWRAGDGCGWRVRAVFIQRT
ncbi:uncharacterized protein [Gossypium hirsutum]|uniref:Transposase MuDR plant domain-containing protein n=1 Tax=Gossypium hirsutum TaxID=3635 RepID=A0ABM3BJ77_GOSHI|nr:uncharacterized protein LOC121228052 [Gossypium hirsutum]